MLSTTQQPRISTSATRKWWGWGEEGKHYSLEDRPAFWPYLERCFGRSIAGRTRPVPIDSIDLPELRLSADHLMHLIEIVGMDGISQERRDRVLHAAGRSYPDLMRLRTGQLRRAPDAVVFPSTQEQVVRLLAEAERLGIAIVPFGGGSSVVGGVEPLRGDKLGVVTCNLERLDRVLHVDRESLVATAEAGIFGPALETALGAQGLTLGHFPQSFEFSTLGGWIAARSAGQNSTRYGKIEDMVQGLRMATPGGFLETHAVPASATGPDLNGLWLGSEGLFGIFTQARVRIRPQPEAQDYRAFLFPGWTEGVAALRALMQEEAPPALVRLSDEEETRTYLSLARVPDSTLEELKRRAGLWYLAQRGTPMHHSCLMLAGYEGPRDLTRQVAERGFTILKKHGGRDLGHGPVRSWQKERFTLPYLRDRLLDHAILIDTLETCCTYSDLMRVYGTVGLAIRSAMAADGLQGLVMCHVSHAYMDGASLYYTFMTPQLQGGELGQWQRIKKAATDAILESGGTISHHHGVGADHQPWLEREHGERNLLALRAVKRQYDPQGILNPGKLFAETDGNEYR
jgi:alkyldihydroxyacetonephosphate synthase